MSCVSCLISVSMCDRVCVGGGCQLILHELCGVNVKVEGHKPKYRILQVVKFAYGQDKILKNLGLGKSTAWWFLGRLYLPKEEICGRTVGYGGFSWLTESTSREWDFELFMDNKELIQTNITEWYPVSAITTGRPQIWHPSILKQRGTSISGNPESFVVYHEVLFLLFLLYIVFVIIIIIIS